ncbi:MAG: hypothetical protein IPN83_08440 [Holophagales bacterium]|nr:hypothetical protein [Holophagales bacterium]
MRARPLALLLPLLLAAGSSLAGEAVRWPVPAVGLMAADAAAAAPPDFKRMLAKHPGRLMEGVKAGLAASPKRDASARRAALASGARGIAKAIRDHKLFADVAYEAGGLVAEASLLFPPSGTAPDDAALLALARSGSSFLGYPSRPFDAPETLVLAKLPVGSPRQDYDAAVSLSARLLAWIWNTAGGDASVAAARPESKGPYKVR